MVQEFAAGRQQHTQLLQSMDRSNNSENFAALDLEASPVPGQQASAVLDLQGNLLRGPLSEKDCALLYQMLVEAGSLKLDSLSRMTVSFQATRYIVARDVSHIYIVKLRA